MPELPEVETTLRGITPYLLAHTILRVVVRDGRLRWPVPQNLNHSVSGLTVAAIRRRGKYLLVSLSSPGAAGQHCGTLIIHLGMSGSLRVVPLSTAVEKHDHIDVVLSNHYCIRYRDPRRFGAWLWHTGPIATHPLLVKLGPEPFSAAFSAHYLLRSCAGRRRSIKQHIMDNAVVVGVGNIYASEALFAAGLRPQTPAGCLGRGRISRLHRAIIAILEQAIAQGGTTLQDFAQADGKPGYFAQQLAVYGREGVACRHCGTPIRALVLGQRRSFYCPSCQRT